MSQIEQLVIKHFPFEVFNPGQKEAIVESVEAFISGKKHVVLQAPTGIGKSAIATTIHRVMSEYRKTRFRTTIITATKGLQDQYENGDKEIYSLKGKTNYECPIGKGYYMAPTCRQHRAEETCNVKQVCTYIRRREHWCKVSDLRLTNTSFQITAPHILTAREETVPNLIVVDECHDVDEQLVNHSVIKIDMGAMEHLRKVTDSVFMSSLVEFINQFMDMPPGTAFVAEGEVWESGRALSNAISNVLADIEEKIENKKGHMDTLMAAQEELMAFADRLGLFTMSNGEWMVTEFAYNNIVELKPIYAFQVAEYGLFSKGEIFLHMSATICGFDAYLKTLGIQDKDAHCIDIENPIPLENRKVTFINRMKISGDFDKSRLTEVVDKIISRHKEQNGIIHTVSFQLGRDIMEHSRYKERMIVSNNRDEILSVLGKHNSGRIILSPSIEKGYDFKGDMSRWQIIAKVPYYYIGDKWVALNMERHPDWYARKAILRLVQASGRSIRGVDDWASTYILDSNFERLWKKNSRLFPEWFLDSVQ